MLIAGAGGAAHLPGMTAAKTALPVLGVPVQSQRAQRPGLAALDRADAGRRTGRHVRDRRGRGDQCRAVRRLDPGARHPEIAQALLRHRAAQTAAVLAQPDPRVPAERLRRPMTLSASSVPASSAACSRSRAIPLGLDFLFLDRSADTPAGQRRAGADRRVHRSALLARARRALRRWSPSTGRTSRCRRCAPLRARGTRAHRARRWPRSPRQDRWPRNALFERLGIPTTRCAPVDSRARLERAVRRHRPAGHAQDAAPGL